MIRDNHYANFAYHVAGRRNKIQLMLNMLSSRNIQIPDEIDIELLYKFNARPFT